MRRALRVLAAAPAEGRVIDTVILTPEQRRSPRDAATGMKGTRFTFDLAGPVALRAGDLLQLDDGNLIEVEHLVDIVEAVLNCGKSGTIPSLTITPRGTMPAAHVEES